MKALRISQGIISLLFSILSVLLVIGKITSGHGLGDLFYLYSLIGLLSLIGVSLVIISRCEERKVGFYRIILFVFCILILVYFIYSFSIGRGPEKSWNGDMFIY